MDRIIVILALAWQRNLCDEASHVKYLTSSDFLFGALWSACANGLEQNEFAVSFTANWTTPTNHFVNRAPTSPQEDQQIPRTVGYRTTCSAAMFPSCLGEERM